MAPPKSTARLPRAESRARIVVAATELVREHSYPELSVGQVMQSAGIERTLFYRHFDDLGDLLMHAGRESIEGLFSAQIDLGESRDGSGTHPEALRPAIERVVDFYERHGPLLRALSEAAAGDERVASGQRALRDRFDELTATSLGVLPQFSSLEPHEVREIARSLNLLNNAYLLDAFGREPRVSAETAVQTLTTIWTGVIFGPRPGQVAD